MTNQNGNGQVPIIGGHKIRGAVGTLGALVRDLDAECTYEPESVVAGPNGQPIAIAGRANVVTAVDLCEMIRQVVREELAAVHKPSGA